jgi:hypothetical protein
MEASKGLDEFKVAHKTIAVIKTMDAFLDCQNVMMSMMSWNEVDTWVSNHVYSAQDCPVKLAAMVRGAPHIDNPGHRFRIRVCVWPIIRVMHGEPTRAVTGPGLHAVLCTPRRPKQDLGERAIGIDRPELCSSRPCVLLHFEPLHPVLENTK